MYLTLGSFSKPSDNALRDLQAQSQVSGDILTYSGVLSLTGLTGDSVKGNTKRGATDIPRPGRFIIMVMVKLPLFGPGSST